MKYENLKHLPEIVQFMDEKSQESFYEIYAPQFVTNIFVEEIIYPNWVKDWDNKDELLAQIESKDLMEPINTMMRNADMNLLTPEEIADETGYYYVAISFAIKPLPKFKGTFKQNSVNIFLIPYQDDKGESQVKIMFPRYAFLGHFYQLKNAELLDINSKDEIDQQYLEKISEAVEIICNEFKITTEKNQGRFVENIKEDPEKLIEEFIEITHAKDFQDKKTIEEFKKYAKMIREKPEKYLKLLIKEDYADEDTEIDEKDFYYQLLKEFLLTYDDDWKMDHEALSEYISEEIGQDFKITYEETLQKPEVVAQKLEKESEYTLLNVDSQMDSYSFFLCKKGEKTKILNLAKKLHFPIEDY
ncbi:hypothetical protein [Chryseobacterium gambrini]|uniref:DUF6630 family protein n=1 Tax=Chryseobacterium gambrini TaxID=373672 RepID=UPI0022F3A55C|nr:hypothetical protein [Chryseobacterium gambrini]WBX95848.1 hypothetical protein PE065_13295 [Chryseobacterium gambrini]